MNTATPVSRILAALIDGVITVLLCITIIGGVIYAFTKDTLPFLNGQSVGKKMMGIKVVTLEGQPITGNYGAGILRQILTCIPFIGALIAVVELVLIFVDKDGIRLGDKIAKTRVIQA